LPLSEVTGLFLEVKIGSKEIKDAYFVPVVSSEGIVVDCSCAYKRELDKYYQNNIMIIV